MDKLQVWFLDVGHGDCAYIQLPNGARMVIDCGCNSDNWPSTMLKHFKITKAENPAPIPEVEAGKYALDCLVISHLHADHFTDIGAIHDEICFYSLSGGYKDFIDKVALDQMDFRKRGQAAAKKFIEVVKKYTGNYVESRDRVAAAKPNCVVSNKRFLEYEDGIDLNDISFLTAVKFAGHKILFAGDLTANGVKRILASDKASQFREFVSGTTFLKVPHHGRDNGCSLQEFDAFGSQPLLCVVSDKVLDEQNEGTANTAWYTNRTSDQVLNINGKMESRKVLTTRKDDDIYLEICGDGSVKLATKCFSNARQQIFGE